MLSQSGRGRLKLTDGETCVTGTMDTALADSYGDLQMGQLLKITAACCFGYTIPTQNQGPAFAAATGRSCDTGRPLCTLSSAALDTRST